MVYAQAPLYPQQPPQSQQQQQPVYQEAKKSKVPSLLITICKVLFIFFDTNKFITGLVFLVLPLFLTALLGMGFVPLSVVSQAAAGQGSEILGSLKTMAYVLAVLFLIAGSLGISAMTIKHNLAARVVFGVYALTVCIIYIYMAMAYQKTILPAFQHLDTFMDKAFWHDLNKSERANIQQSLKCCGYSSTSDSPALPCPAGATSGCKSKLLSHSGIPQEGFSSLFTPHVKVSYIAYIVQEVILIVLGLPVIIFRV